MSDSGQIHDHFFKSLFSQRQVALDYIRQFLPNELWKEIDLRTLTLSSNSYIDEKLEESFADLVYTCKWKGQGDFYLCFLLEHKSYPVKYPHLQLLRYMLGIWEQNQKDKVPLKMVIPIIIYHGKEKWRYRSFEDYFEKTAPIFKAFIPSFDYHLTDLSSYDDAFLLKLRAGFLINGFLVMKHKADTAYFLKNVNRIFIYGEQFENSPLGDQSLLQILAYILKVSKMDKEIFNQFIKEMNKNIKSKAISTYDMILQEGREEGIEQGREEGLILVVRNFIKKSPETPDETIAELLGVSIKLVQKVREEIETETE